MLGAHDAASRPLARVEQRLSSASVSGPGSGTLPPQFLATIDSTRCAEIAVVVGEVAVDAADHGARAEKSPSLPNGTSRSRK